jgi:hypothetical protein
MVRGLIALGLLSLVLLEWGGMMLLREAAEQWERHERWEAFEASELPRSVLLFDVARFLEVREGSELHDRGHWYDVLEVRLVGNWVYVLAIDDADEARFRERFDAKEQGSQSPFHTAQVLYKWKYTAEAEWSFTEFGEDARCVPSIYPYPPHFSWMGSVPKPPPKA